MRRIMMTSIKSRSNSNIYFYLETLILLILLIIVIKYIYNIINILNTAVVFNQDNIIWVKDAKDTLEMNNIKIEDLGPQIDKIRDGSLYIAGMTAGAKIVKNSSIPLAAKLGTTLGLGAASIIGYKITVNSFKSNTHTGKVSATIDKVNYNRSTSNNKSNFINNLTNESNDSNDNYNIISSLDIEQLQLIFYLNLIIIYLLSMVIVFFLMKQISTLNLNFNFLLKLPYGNTIQNLVIKIFKLWEKTSSIWIYAILIIVLVNLGLSSWAIYVVLGHIK
jgi:hypothetical protein